MNFENKKQPEDLKKNLTEDLGSLLHDEWRSGRKKEDGTYQERFKVLAIIEKDGEKKKKWFNRGEEPEESLIILEQDIANTDFKDLHEDWKKDNAEAAKVAMDLVFNKLETGEDIDIEEASDIVHEEWKKRNSWNTDPVLMGPYKDLPEEEKQKDRDQVLKAIDIYKKKKY